MIYVRRIHKTHALGYIQRGARTRTALNSTTKDKKENQQPIEAVLRDGIVRRIMCVFGSNLLVVTVTGWEGRAVIVL